MDWKHFKELHIKPKNLYITLREILTGKIGPSMNELLTLMNKDEIIKRVETNCEEKIKLYDSTLRDGAQTRGVNFSLDDKIKIISIWWNRNRLYWRRMAGSQPYGW